jgi:hypothetical protein
LDPDPVGGIIFPDPEPDLPVSILTKGKENYTFFIKIVNILFKILNIRTPMQPTRKIKQCKQGIAVKIFS